MIKIGITGGIGSGKSFVCRLLENEGWPIYSCDSRAKILMTENQNIKTTLISLLGESIYLDDGSINKAMMAAFIFANKDNTEKINSIVHPEVKADFLQWCDRQSSPLAFMESAILFESGFDNAVDKTLMVYAPVNVRVRRVMKRDGLRRKDILERMESQMDDEAKKALCDYCVLNFGNRNIQRQVKEITKNLVGLAKRE